MHESPVGATFFPIHPRTHRKSAANLRFSKKEYRILEMILVKGKNFTTGENGQITIT
jgi:hypothetical protein